MREEKLIKRRKRVKRFLEQFVGKTSLHVLTFKLYIVILVVYCVL